MVKRIVKETLNNGEEQYRVEECLIPFLGKLWTTATMPIILDNGTETYTDAVFDSLEEAQRFCGIEPNEKIVTKREIITYKE